MDKYNRPCNDIDELVQERRNSSADALELRLSCTNPSICSRITVIVDVISGYFESVVPDIDCLVPEKRNSSTLTMEFRLSCTNPSTPYGTFR